MLKEKLKVFKFLLEKEFKQLFRNGFLPRMIITFPITSILIMPWAANMEIKNINLSILDQDKSPISQSLTAKIDASDYFILTQSATDIKDAMNCIETGKCDIILEIPSGFEKGILKNSAATPAIYANAINSTKGIIGSGYLANIINDFRDFRQADEAPVKDKITPPINFIPKYYFNPNLDYKSYMIPALMVMVLSMLCGFLPALNIVSEKEKGNIEQINVTPVNRLLFILAKLIPYWLAGFMVLSVCFLLAYFVYGLSPRGHIGIIYMIAFLYTLTIAGAGIVISNYSNTSQQAMFVIYFFMLILMLMSGLFTPISSMPKWAMDLTTINPLRYFIESLRMLYLKGSPLPVLWKNFAALFAFALFFNTWAVISYKKRG